MPRLLPKALSFPSALQVIHTDSFPCLPSFDRVELLDVATNPVQALIPVSLGVLPRLPPRFRN